MYTNKSMYLNNFAISSWSETQSAPSLFIFFFLLTVEGFYISAAKEYNQSDFDIDHQVMSMCRVISCVVGRGYLLWPVHSLGKTVLAFDLLHFVLQGQTCLLLQVISWLLTFSFHSPMMKRIYFFCVSSRRSCRSS